MDIKPTNKVFFTHTLFEFLTYFFCFFPYIKILPMNTDTQPYAAIVCFFVFIIKFNNKMNKSIVWLLILLILSLTIGILSLASSFFRDIFGFFSVFIICYSALFFLETRGFNEKLFYFFSLIWIIVGIVQLILDRSFLSFLLPSMRTSDTRGVTSLAVEPSYFGIILLFFILINFLIDGKKIWYFIYSFCIILLSQSTMIILYLSLFFILYFFERQKILFFFFSIILLALLLLISNLSINSRLIELLQQLIKIGPLALVKLDTSINDRIGHIFYSFKGFVNNYFLPNGFDHWGTYLAKELPKQNFFYGLSTGRIMSTYGSCLFNLGFIGLILPIVYIKNILQIRQKDIKFVLFVFLNIFFLTAIPVAFPLIGFLLALIIHKNNTLVPTMKMSIEGV